MGIYNQLVYGDNKRKFVGKPVEDLKQSLEVLDTRYRGNKANIDSLDVMEANIDLLDVDYGVKKAQIDKTRELLKNAVEQGDLEFQGAAVQGAYKDFATNKGLQRAQGNYAAYQAYIAELEANKDISDRDRQILATNALNSYKGVQVDPATGVTSGTLRGHKPAAYVNEDDLMNEALKDFAADQGGGENVVIGNDGYIYKNGSKWKSVADADVQRYAQQYLANHKGLQNWKQTNAILLGSKPDEVLNSLAGAYGADNITVDQEANSISIKDGEMTKSLTLFNEDGTVNPQLVDMAQTITTSRAVDNATNKFGFTEKSTTQDITTDATFMAKVKMMEEANERLNMKVNPGEEKTIEAKDYVNVSKNITELEGTIKIVQNEIATGKKADGSVLTGQEIETRKRALSEYTKTLSGLNSAKLALYDQMRTADHKDPAQRADGILEDYGTDDVGYNAKLKTAIEQAILSGDIDQFKKDMNIADPSFLRKHSTYTGTLISNVNKAIRKHKKSLGKMKDAGQFTTVDRNDYYTSTDKDVAGDEKKSTYLNDLLGSEQLSLSSGTSFADDYGMSANDIFTNDGDFYSFSGDKKGKKDSIPSKDKSEASSLVFNPDGRFGASFILKDDNGNTLRRNDNDLEATEVLYSENQEQARASAYSYGKRLYENASDPADRKEGELLMARSMANNLYSARIDQMRGGAKKPITVPKLDGNGGYHFQIIKNDSGEGFKVNKVLVDKNGRPTGQTEPLYETLKDGSKRRLEYADVDQFALDVLHSQ